jgi:zinc D-Ala-D-Ala dipeptidase
MLFRALALISVGLGLACAGLSGGAPPPMAPPKLPQPAAAPPPSLAEVVSTAPVGLATPPSGFVDLREVLPDAQFEIRYSTKDNFTSTVLPGYGAPGAWLREGPAGALAEVQAELAAQGRTLRIYDGYRPLRATRGMVAWAERTDHVHLLDQHYVARYSGHNRGNTIDLSIADAKTGAELDMGNAWDTLDESSHTKNATGVALENRLALKAAMERHGFKNYWREWWHYTFTEPGEADLPHRDVPYGCAEPPEGKWAAPVDWSQPGATVAPPPVGPCR